MKVFLAVALFNLIAFVQCKGVEKTSEFGVKGDDDIHLYSEFFSVYRSTIDRNQCISFPPSGLINYYNITYVRVNDYNPSLATVKKVDGDIGSGYITICLRAPVLRRIEATVDIFGTFIGPCFNKDSSNKDADNKDSDNKVADNKDSDNKVADNKDNDKNTAEDEANNNNYKPDIDIRAGDGEGNNQVASNENAPAPAQQ